MLATIVLAAVPFLDRLLPLFYWAPALYTLGLGTRAFVGARTSRDRILAKVNGKKVEPRDALPVNPVMAQHARRTKETYVFSNVVPLVGDRFNSSYYACVEQFICGLTVNFETVMVWTVLLYQPYQQLDKYARANNLVLLGKNGLPDIHVPTHVAKIIVTFNACRTRTVLSARERATVGGVTRLIGEPTPYATIETRPMAQNVAPAPGSAALGILVFPNVSLPDTLPLSGFKSDLDTVQQYSGLQFSHILRHSSWTDLTTQRHQVMPTAHTFSRPLPLRY